MKITELPSKHFVIEELLPEECTYVDIGACLGDVVRDILNIRPKATVYAYEPSASNCKELEKIGGIVVVNGAVIGRNNGKKIEFVECVGGSKGYKKNGYVEDGRTQRDGCSFVKYVVDTYSIGGILAALGHVDYMKIAAGSSSLDIVRGIKTEHDIVQISIEAQERHKAEIGKTMTWENDFEWLFTRGKELFFRKVSRDKSKGILRW
jgi:hypothetical protein